MYSARRRQLWGTSRPDQDDDQAERDVVTQLKAAAKAAADQHRQDNKATERREEQMGQMCNALKAA